MVEDGEKRGRARRSGEVDWISDLPESLIFQIFLNLPTKDVVKTSVLSTRWRHFWRYVPGLDLENCDFPDHNTLVSFVDTFLGFNSDCWLQSFKLNYNINRDDKPEAGLVRRWVNTVVDRKVKHLDLSEYYWDIVMPPTIYTCESLVCLKLCALTLSSPKFVSLPSLKVIILQAVQFTDNLALETLISSCPVLESLYIDRSFSDETDVLRVCSSSLLSFTHVSDVSPELVEDLAVVVDAPRLKFLRLSDGRVASFIINNPSSLVEADIDTEFNLSYGRKFNPNDLPKRIMHRNFLVGISNVKHSIIASNTLEVIYEYSRCERLPLFRNLSFLRVEFYSYRWEMLPIFLENCPNLKSLVVASRSTTYQEDEEINIISGPRCFLSSLEYVDIKRPLKGEAMEMQLVSYFLENSPTLKKLTLCLDISRKTEESAIFNSAIFKELLSIPRLSSACQVVLR